MARSGGQTASSRMVVVARNAKIRRTKARLLEEVPKLQRGEFVARLPNKVRHGVDLERPFTLDVSRAKDLIEGEREYYEKQFATLRSFEEVDSLHTNTIDEEQELEEQANSEFAMKISNYANIALLALKIYATIRSGSIAIAAPTLDSLLDLMAGGILWFTHLSMKNINIYKYPIGKLRVQPVGIIIFAAVMATLDGIFEIEYFQQTEESNQFRHDYEMRKMKQVDRHVGRHVVHILIGCDTRSRNNVWIVKLCVKLCICCDVINFVLNIVLNFVM
ncbi:metal tolerance protein 4-like [Curcuma longa]|uniref:metal tolerance protein 4-like n=1 Tax=Curcuma longa TaxID=136217 RepID=UPI003D9FAED3